MKRHSKHPSCHCETTKWQSNFPPQVIRLPRVLWTLAMTVFLLFCGLTFALFTSPVYAACNPALSLEQRGADCPAGLDQIEAMIANIISVIVGLGFIAMLVLLIWAGFKYLTSGGEPKAVQAAHAVTTWALLGILFMAVAWLVLQLLGTFSGIPVTVFNIKTLCVDPKNLANPFPFCSPGP